MTKFEDKTAVDFVIVGAGGAGGVVAKELSTAGFQVVVLEQGPYLHEGDFIHDELKFKDVFDPPFIGQEVLTNDHTLQPNTFRKTARDKAVLASFAQYGRCVGGGTVHFTGNYWRLHEVDFLERSRWGPVEGTGLADCESSRPRAHTSSRIIRGQARTKRNRKGNAILFVRACPCYESLKRSRG